MPSGYFDGTAAGRKQILIRSGKELETVPIEKKANQLYRPGLLGTVLAGEQIKSEIGEPMRLNLLIASLWLSCILMLGLSGQAVAQEPAPEVNVEVLVRGPDGKPLADTPVKWLPSDQHVFGKNPATVNITTDGNGWARHTWPSDQPHIVVLAPDIGHGATGTFAVTLGKSSSPTLPPLSPCGMIEGIVPEVQRSEDTRVWLNGWEWLVPVVNCDRQGHFLLPNIPAGHYWVQAETKGEGDAKERVFSTVLVEVPPGKHVAQVELALSKRISIPYMPPPAGKRGQGEKSLVWAEGMVRDEAGQPIEDADVIARGEFHGGLRMYEILHAARTDARGHWEIIGESQLSMFHGFLIAHKVGYPYVVMELQDPSADVKAQAREGKLNAEKPDAAKQAGQLDQAKAASPENPRYDFVLPSEGCRLDVLITYQGKPVADVAVSAAQEQGPELSSPFYVGSGHGIARDRAQRILQPVAITDQSGLAHLADLPAGSYSIIAAENGEAGLFAARDRHFSTYKGNVGRYHGIVLRAGQTRKFHGDLAAAESVVCVEIRQPEGTPVAKLNSEIEWSPISEGGWRSGAKLNEKGQELRSLQHPGLSRVAYIYVEPPLQRVTWFHPYCRAEAILAASPLLQDSPPLVLTAIRHQNDPGSIVVQLQDAAGKPAHGQVQFCDAFVDGFRAASTDANCEVRFDGVLRSTLKLRGHLPGIAVQTIGEDSKAWPADNELLGHLALFDETVTVKDNTTTRLVMRPQKACYVRGVVHPAAGKKTEDYAINIDWSLKWVSTFVDRYEKSTGKFLIGPLAAGKLQLTLRCHEGKDNWPVCLVRDINVAEDRVNELVIDAPAIPVQDDSPLRESQYLSIGVAGAQSMGQLRQGIDGGVFLPDGKTPARGAQVALFVPGTLEPVARGRTNHEGRFSLVGSWFSRNAIPGKPQMPDRPTMVAWVPGKYGAAIVPLPVPARASGVSLTLPKSLTLRGKVTVAGEELLSKSSLISLFAEHLGDDAFRALSHQRCCADADGNFELPGLTPGEYRVQAVLDNIWLSASITVAVDPAADKLAPITLDIGEPGCATVLTLVDKQGKPLPGVEATLLRPAGPLAKLCWPEKFAADQAGTINVPPLEMGDHKIRIAGLEAEQTLHVAKLGVPHTPGRITLTHDRLGK